MLIVIYRWKLKAGNDQAFIKAWSQMTKLVCQRYGSLGSRLHRVENDNNFFIAYAQWPNKQMFTTFSKHKILPDESYLLEIMKSCVKQHFKHEILEVISDQLLPLP